MHGKNKAHRLRCDALVVAVDGVVVVCVCVCTCCVRAVFQHFSRAKGKTHVFVLLHSLSYARENIRCMITASTLL